MLSFGLLVGHNKHCEGVNIFNAVLLLATEYFYSMVLVLLLK